jgi:hypothetical protein
VADDLSPLRVMPISHTRTTPDLPEAAFIKPPMVELTGIMYLTDILKPVQLVLFLLPLPTQTLFMPVWVKLVSEEICLPEMERTVQKMVEKHGNISAWAIPILLVKL